MDNEKYLDILFDDSDFICPCSKTNEEGKPIEIQTIQKKNYIWNPNDQWVSLNAYKAYSTRRIENIATFRNILLEIDNAEYREQLQHIKAYGVPYSICTYSGRVSYHYIISLEDPITLEEYKKACSIIKYNMDLIDKACLEPSTFTRMAGSVRNKITQKLMECSGRIKNADFYSWLDTLEKPLKTHTSTKVRPIKKTLSKFTQYLLKNGIKSGKMSRHDKLKSMAIDMLLAGMTESEAINNLTPALINFNPDKTEDEVIRIVNWVYNESDLAQNR